MQDINNCIKENDTDNVTLKKLKELGTKLTGQENVQGETVSEVLDFINSNYSGGGSGSKTVIYTKDDDTYAYKDADCTTKFTKDELFNAYMNDALIHSTLFKHEIYLNVIGVAYNEIYCTIGARNILVSDDMSLSSSEYIPVGPN